MYFYVLLFLYIKNQTFRQREGQKDKCDPGKIFLLLLALKLFLFLSILFFCSHVIITCPLGYRAS